MEIIYTPCKNTLLYIGYLKGLLCRPHSSDIRTNIYYTNKNAQCFGREVTLFYLT